MQMSDFMPRAEKISQWMQKREMPEASLSGGLLFLSHGYKELYNIQWREITAYIIFSRIYFSNNYS